MLLLYPIWFLENEFLLLDDHTQTFISLIIIPLFVLWIVFMFFIRWALGWLLYYLYGEPQVLLGVENERP